MENSFKTKVYYADTDAFGVVWHGTYLRWLERGRMDFCENFGIDFAQMQQENIVMPVTSLDIKYKISAKLSDTLEIKSKITELTPLYVVFNQKIYFENTTKLCLEANVKVVAVDNNGKLYRKMPQKLYDILNEIKESANETK